MGHLASDIFPSPAACGNSCLAETIPTDRSPEEAQPTLEYIELAETRLIEKVGPQ